ncbi:MAG: thioredoxin domain-containing protein, partial [Bradymonadaceae bacterium]
MKSSRIPFALVVAFFIVGLTSCDCRGSNAEGPVKSETSSTPAATQDGEVNLDFSKLGEGEYPFGYRPLEHIAVDPKIPGGLEVSSELEKILATALASRGEDYEPRTHHFNDDGSPTYTNRMIMEKSPYLIQHAHNPVNWMPWGKAAFERARSLNRPVIMSVGYSTCHWCHVMERESFEDVEIAKFMNENFVSIKVDREERPDVDDIYMKAVHMMAGRGGWPMTVVMTPEGEPFFGGTYFPPRDGDRGSRKGFLTILRELDERYRTDESKVVAEAKTYSERIRRAAQPARPGNVPGPEALEQVARNLAQSFDATNGGFGGAPKFPQPPRLEFLLHYHRRTQDPVALELVTKTLEEM